MDLLNLQSTTGVKSNFESGNEFIHDISHAQPLQPPRRLEPPKKHRWSMEENIPSGSQGDNSIYSINFPPLAAGGTKFLKAMFEKRLENGKHTETGKGVPAIHTIPTNEIPSCHGVKGNGAETENHHQVSTPTLAEILKTGKAQPTERKPITFQPNKVKKMGIAGESEGTPSIYFTSEDAKFLEERMGLTVVGKFSHSIPSTSTIKANLNKIEFSGPYVWNNINAKHVEIKFEDLANYAKMLNGPNGTPVWFLDSHPMRVFKWTPNFDPFFETPIAAIWCNLIGLPIHLFEESALFAIGSILGKPIQIDHATANRSRLSFARICVEIDISKPQPEEIILDIMGREIKQRVKWDNIPRYCTDCKHVGHSRSACYAFGKREIPSQTNFQPSHQARQPRGNFQPNKGGYKPETSAAGEARGAEKHSGAAPQNETTDQHNGHGWQFKKNKNRRNRYKSTNTAGTVQRPQSEGEMEVHASEAVTSQDNPPYITGHHRGGGRGGIFRGGGRGGSGRGRGNRFDILNKPKYYRQLENGEFDVETMEDEVNLEDCIDFQNRGAEEENPKPGENEDSCMEDPHPELNNSAREQGVVDSSGGLSC